MATSTGSNDTDVKATIKKLDRAVAGLNIPSCKFIDDQNDVETWVNFLEQKFDELVVDCEGVNLGRGGYLTLLQIGAGIEESDDNVILIFDILKIGKVAFDLGLKRILESSAIVKIMYDCRADSYNLWHEFGVRLSNVYDIQLLEYIVRIKTGGLKTVTTPKWPWQYRTAVITGLGEAVEFYVIRWESFRCDIKELKKTVRTLMQAEPEIWQHRPVTLSLQAYAASDVFFIRKLFKHLKRRSDIKGIPFNAIEKRKLKEASERYAGVRRDVEKVDDMFLNTPILQSYIVSTDGNNDTSFEDFPIGTAKCNGCKRMMPDVGVDKLCIDCMEIKRVNKVKEANPKPKPTYMAAKSRRNKLPK